MKSYRKWAWGDKLPQIDNDREQTVDENRQWTRTDNTTDYLSTAKKVWGVPDKGRDVPKKGAESQHTRTDNRAG